MSVYTPLSHNQLATVLDGYGFRLLDFRAASHGIENSTFLIEAEDSHQQPAPLVLTVFETLDHNALTPYLALLGHLAKQALPVPAPLQNHDGHDQITVAGKPAVLMPRLPGEHDFAVDLDRCRQVGALLARLHQCETRALQALPDERQRLERLATHLHQLPDEHREGATALLSDWQARPTGTTLIHGDLFRDNLLWQQGRISALLDFYNACLDYPEYDLAVTLNDWCVDSNGKPVAEREQALLESYREFGGQVDDSLLLEALAVAALRFWLSRLAGPVSAQSEGQGSKDPEEFARIFQWRIAALAG
jgi:homoserine kinase type II